MSYRNIQYGGKKHGIILHLVELSTLKCRKSGMVIQSLNPFGSLEADGEANLG